MQPVQTGQSGVIAAKPAVYFGPGAVGELPGAVRAAGADQVVVVTETSLASAPVTEAVLTTLAGAGLPARLFAGVHPQPTPADLAAGAEAVAQAAAAAASASAASASAAAVTAMLQPSAPLVTASSSSGPHPVLPPATHQPADPHRALQPPPPFAVTPVPRIVLVAVGGRAAIDAAKGVAAGASGPPGDPAKGVAAGASGPPGDPAGAALPIVAVPTLTGTGAEASAAGLVTDPADGRVIRVGDAGTMPVAVILDPELTAGLPPAVTAGCGLDALARALESYLSARANPWSDGIALQVIRMVAASLPRAMTDGTDLAARSQLLLAGHMAGVAAASTGPGLGQAIARSLGAHRDVAPGTVLAMLLPEVLRFTLPARAGRMAEVAFALGVGDTHAGPWLNAEAAVGAVTALRDDAGLSRPVSDLGLTEAALAQVCADTLADEGLAGTSRPPTEADIRTILLTVTAQPR